MTGSRHRIFHARQPDPITFTVDGFVRAPADGEPETWEETFTVLGAVPPAILLKLLATVQVDNMGRAMYQVPALLAFMGEALVPEDVQRWNALMSDRDRLFDGELLGQLVEWLGEEMFGRPLVRSGGSLPTRSPASTSSPPASSTPADGSRTSTPSSSSPSPTGS